MKKYKKKKKRKHKMFRSPNTSSHCFIVNGNLYGVLWSDLIHSNDNILCIYLLCVLICSSSSLNFYLDFETSLVVSRIQLMIVHIYYWTVVKICFVTSALFFLLFVLCYCCFATYVSFKIERTWEKMRWKLFVYVLDFVLLYFTCYCYFYFFSLKFKNMPNNWFLLHIFFVVHSSLSSLSFI